MKYISFATVYMFILPNQPVYASINGLIVPVHAGINGLFTAAGFIWVCVMCSIKQSATFLQTAFCNTMQLLGNKIVG